MSDEQARVQTLNCTACGAPFELRGGHKVASYTCAYCGTVLDKHEKFAKLKQFENAKQTWPTPLELGTRGRLKGVDFTVIGMVEFRDEDHETWIEHQLYSPTHGYAWLEFTAGNHWVFSREVKDVPYRMPTQTPKAKFQVRARTYQFYEKYPAWLKRAAGELTWLPKPNEKRIISEGIAPPYGYFFEGTGAEQEFGAGEYLSPQQVWDAFKLDGEPFQVRGVHPMQPYTPSRLALATKAYTPWFLAISFFITLVLVIFFGGNTVAERSFGSRSYQGNSTATVSFDVTKPNYLVRLSLRLQSLKNAWTYLDVTVQNARGQEVFNLGKTVEYYAGSSGGESWSEGSRSASVYFKVPEAGRYTMKINGREGGLWGYGTRNSPLKLEVREGVVVSRYFVLLTLLALFGFLVSPLSKWRMGARRWAPVLKSDDD